MARRPISQTIRREVLTEAGYRCAVPTCRTILAIDLHHVVRVAENGPNTTHNLIALCPNCHRLYHRGEIDAEAIRVWKGMLVTLNRAFDKDAMDMLLFLALEGDKRPIGYNQSDVLQYRSLIVSGLVEMEKIPQPKGGIRVGSYAGRDFTLNLTYRGRTVIEAWKAGDKVALQRALAEGAGRRQSAVVD